MNLEHKYADLTAESVTDEGLIAGYASVFNIVDQGGDKVLPGAYAKSLSVRRPVMLWGHNSSQPIGAWTSVTEDAKGLRVEGALALGTIKGREAYELLKMGAISGLSIGYMARKADREGGTRLLREVDVFEISLVSMPMQVEAGIDTVKSMDELFLASKSGDFAPLKHAVEGALRDAGFPAWMAKAQAALAPQALGDGRRDASASEIADLIRMKFSF